MGLRLGTALLERDMCQHDRISERCLQVDGMNDAEIYFHSLECCRKIITTIQWD